MRIKLKGPLDLVHARGLAAVMRDLDARQVEPAVVTVHVHTGNGGTKPVLVHDPNAVASEAEAKFKSVLSHAVREAVEGKTSNWFSRTASAVSDAAKSAAVSAGQWISDKTPENIREGVAATSVYARDGAIAAGRVIGAGVEAAGVLAKKFEVGRNVLQRVENAEVVATRVIVEVVDRNGIAVSYAPWVIDPIATLRNEKTAALLNGTMTTLGWGPIGPIAQATLAAGFGIWSCLSVDAAEGRARANMGIDQLLQAVVSLVPFASFYTLPAATAKDIADARAVSEAMERGDPFVSYWPGTPTAKAPSHLAEQPSPSTQQNTAKR